MKHIQLFEGFGRGFSDALELPEGYSLHIFGKDEDSLMQEWGSTRYYEEAYASIEEWKESLNQMGEIQDPTGSGKTFYRGTIQWGPMGIDYIYELRPF